MSRRGAVAVLIAFLSVVLFGMVAFALDIGWIALTKSELQNAADSTALAAAEQLMSGYVQYNSPFQPNQGSIQNSSEASAQIYATQYAGFNAAGGVSSLALNNADIVFGFTDSNGNFSAGASGFPNSVQTTMRRDGSANGPLALFFGPVLGNRTTAVTATATATIYAGTTITGFNTASGINGLLLPVALDENHWNQFVKNGTSPDGNVYNGSNGAAELQVYPSPGNAPGNFGLLDIGPPANNIPAFRTWIDNGPSSSDLSFLTNNGLLPATPSSPAPWKGGPGLKSTLVTNFASIMGLPRLMPIFQPISTNPYQAASGNGSNTYYNIVGFVGVTITQATGNGSNMNISVQASAVLDPTAVYDVTTVAPAGTGSSGLATTFVPPKLTQ
jgi:Flp pilus assembly protein TadG